MSISKGYPSKERDLTLQQHDVYVTAEPVREKQVGESVVAHQYVYAVGTDDVEASSTTQILNLTAHSVKIGDIIRFTSGALSGQEVKVSDIPSANTVKLSEVTSVAASAADTIQILRHKYPVINADGSIPVSTTLVATPILFTLNGADQEVVEDTGTPANNRPLPVKLTGVTGDINITAGDLNIAMDAANDSVRLGDGTTLANVSLSNELQVRDDDANTALSSVDGKITACNTGAVVISSSALPTGAATEASLSSIDGKVTACNTGAVTISASALPTGAATEATLAALDAKVTAVNTGAVVISSSSLPTGAATESTLSTISGNITACNTGAVTISSSALPTGAATAANQASILAKIQGALTPVDFLDSGVVDSSSSNIPAAGLTVVASLAADCEEIQIVEDIGEFMTLTDGSDAILAYLPLGGGTVKVSISSGTALKLASVSGATISVGKIAINFLG